jgi:hypothetical protein
VRGRSAPTLRLRRTTAPPASFVDAGRPEMPQSGPGEQATASLLPTDTNEPPVPTLLPPRAEPLAAPGPHQPSSHPARELLREVPTEPVVHVSIGSVEVRTPPAAAQPSRPASRLISLDDYLRGATQRRR